MMALGRVAALAAGVAAIAAAVSTAACSDGSPSSPAAPDAGFAVCPTGIDPSFTSILTKVLATSSCGVDVTGDCHSHSGASDVTGTGNMLDYSLDAGAVYAELLGDGGGHPSTNLAGNAGRIPRVAPFDAGASMLYIKLNLTTRADPRYGAGMPLTAPGSVCPATLDAIQTWIDQGAANN
jgi:hypothetical protein